MTDARVILWGRDIAAVSWDDRRELGVFQYDPEFVSSGIQVSPLMMPLKQGIFEFPSLAVETFKRLPGLLADSLPDKFGNTLIDTTKQSRPGDYGSRNMGQQSFQAEKSRPKN